MSILAVLILVFFTMAYGADEICKSGYQHGSCVCDLADGSGTIDLSALATKSQGNPFKSEGTYESYYLTLCGNIPAPSECNSASACYKYYSYTTYDIGDKENTRFESRKCPTGSPQATCNAFVTDSTRSGYCRRSIVLLTCDKTATDTNFTVTGQGSSDPDCTYTYNMELRGPDVCVKASGGGAGGLSGGSILLIIFFSVLGAYLIFGFIFCTFVQHKEGRERFPNYNFWVAQPQNAKEGTLCIWHSILRCTGRYQPA